MQPRRAARRKAMRVAFGESGECGFPFGGDLGEQQEIGLLARHEVDDALKLVIAVPDIDGRRRESCTLGTAPRESAGTRALMSGAQRMPWIAAMRSASAAQIG